MKISRTMQEVISKLAEKHGLDLTAQEARLRLDMEGFDRLVVEKIGTHLVSVGHYYEQRGDLVADPETVFFISDTGWVPTEITQVLGGHRIYSIVADGGQDVAVIDPRRQADLASFAEMWARNIESQGWLEDAEKCAALFKENSENIDGVLVTLPNFGDERAVANTLRMSG